eukprot:g3205.t1
MTEPDSWEDLEQLTLQPVSKPNHEQKTQNAQITRAPVDTEQAPNKDESGEDGVSLDQALKEALKNPRERANVLRIEADVSKFVSDKTRCTIEFASDLSSYQRLLAHRVSQLYGLQTSSLTFGNGLSKVIAHKTQNTKFPPVLPSSAFHFVRVIDVKDIYRPPEAERANTPPDVVIKKRMGAAPGHMLPDGSTPGGHDSGTGPRTVKQREEEYKAARDRILGPEETSEVVSNVLEEVEEDGKNRKAIFRDRFKEQQDPDYKRDANRFQPPLVYEQRQFGDATTHAKTNANKITTTGVYNVPSYSTEFPALPGSRPQYSVQYPGPGGYPPVMPRPLLPYSHPTTPAAPAVWPVRPRGPPGGPPVSTQTGMNPGVFGFPGQFSGYPGGYPVPPRGAYFQPPGAGEAVVPQVRTLRRKPVAPPSTEGSNIRKL